MSRLGGEAAPVPRLSHARVLTRLRVVRSVRSYAAGLRAVLQLLPRRARCGLAMTRLVWTLLVDLHAAAQSESLRLPLHLRA